MRPRDRTWGWVKEEVETGLQKVPEGNGAANSDSL